MRNAGGEAEKPDRPCGAGGQAKWRSPSGQPPGGFLENRTETYPVARRSHPWALTYRREMETTPPRKPGRVCSWQRCLKRLQTGRSRNMSPRVNAVKRSVAHTHHEAGSALERRSGRHTNSPRVSRALRRVGAPGSRGHGLHGSISVTLSR